MSQAQRGGQHEIAQNGTLCKTYELFISGIFILYFGPWLTVSNWNHRLGGITTLMFTKELPLLVSEVFKLLGIF